jgi:adenylate cyclase
MGLEIERKFLVAGDFRPFAKNATRIIQGYLSSIPERTVRVRIKDNQGFLTVKGKGSESGTTRFEWEKEITLADARELFTLCRAGRIEKTRYLVPNGPHTIEVDEFHGDNEGLVFAEIELSDVNEPFERPAFLGAEVTGDPHYYNAYISKHPYPTWER